MIHKAILELYPNVSTILNVDGVDTILDIDNQPIEVDYELANKKVAEYIQQSKDTAYQRLRAKEYPPMKDYLDAIVKGDQLQLQSYIDACLAVKLKYPKP